MSEALAIIVFLLSFVLGVMAWRRCLANAKQKGNSRWLAHFYGYLLLSIATLGPTQVIERGHGAWWIFSILALLGTWVFISDKFKKAIPEESTPGALFTQGLTPSSGKKQPSVNPSAQSMQAIQQPITKVTEVDRLRQTLEMVQVDAAQQLQAKQAETERFALRVKLAEQMAITQSQCAESALKELQALKQQIPQMTTDQAAAQAEQLVELKSQLDDANAIQATAMDQALGSLIEICGALAADQKLTNEEVHYLKTWLDRHPLVLASAPGLAIAHKVAAVLADGKITPRERSDLLELLLMVAAGEWREDGSQSAFPAAKSAPAKAWLLLDAQPAQIETQVKPKTSAPKKRVRASSTPHIDEIEFDYLDAKGDLSSRRVLVREVTFDRVKGVCTMRRGYREFLLHRIVGDVTSVQTGVVAQPLAWATAID